MPPRVLLVDDDALVTRALARVLSHHCALEVVTALNVTDALDRLNAESFDVLVSDALLPGLSGPTLLKLASQRWPTMRRVLYSGHIEPAAFVPGYEFAEALLSKADDPGQNARIICDLAYAAINTDGSPP